MLDAFCKGVASIKDKEIWDVQQEKSSFQTAFNTFTSIDKIYRGMLNDLNFFINNCSVEGLLNFQSFYENQLGIPFKELYESSVNSYKPPPSRVNEPEDLPIWWQDMFEDFRYDYTKFIKNKEK